MHCEVILCSYIIMMFLIRYDADMLHKIKKELKIIRTMLQH